MTPKPQLRPSIMRVCRTPGIPMTHQMLNRLPLDAIGRSTTPSNAG